VSSTLRSGRPQPRLRCGEHEGSDHHRGARPRVDAPADPAAGLLCRTSAIRLAILPQPEEVPGEQAREREDRSAEGRLRSARQKHHGEEVRDQAREQDRGAERSAGWDTSIRRAVRSAPPRAMSTMAPRSAPPVRSSASRASVPGPCPRRTGPRRREGGRLRGVYAPARPDAGACAVPAPPVMRVVTRFTRFSRSAEPMAITARTGIATATKLQSGRPRRRSPA